MHNASEEPDAHRARAKEILERETFYLLCNAELDRKHRVNVGGKWRRLTLEEFMLRTLALNGSKRALTLMKRMKRELYPAKKQITVETTPGYEKMMMEKS